MSHKVSSYLLFSNAVGTMVGAGMYSTVGEVCKLVGSSAWLAFLLSGLSVTITAISMASLISRHPKAGAIANFVTRAFANQFGNYMAFVLGICSVLETLLALSATGLGFGEALYRLLPEDIYIGKVKLDPTIISIIFMAILWFVNRQGLKTSSWFSLVGTIIEVGGLIFVIFAGVSLISRSSFSLNFPEKVVTPYNKLFAMLGGIHLTTFAFGGVQGILDLAEEAENPKRDLPRALILATIFTTLLYALVTLSAVHVVSHLDLASGSYTLVHVVTKSFPWIPYKIYGSIIVFAIANTSNGIYQTVTRILCGLANQKLIPFERLAKRNDYDTPTFAVNVVFALAVVILISFHQLHFLVEATSNFILVLFLTCNVTLLILQGMDSGNKGSFEVHWIFPLLGLVCNFIVLVAELYDSVLKVAINWIGLLGGTFVVWYFFVKSNRSRLSSSSGKAKQKPN